MTPEQNDDQTEQRDDDEVQYATEPTLARTLIEERSGYPAHLPASEGEGDSGLLRVGFHDRDENLKEISWDQFREEFDEKGLALAYRDDGDPVDDDRPVVLVQEDNAEDVVD